MKKSLIIILALMMVCVAANVSSGQVCDDFENLLLNTFDCCGSGAGSQQCSGVETAFSATGCGTLTCGPPPTGTIAYVLEDFGMSKLKYYDLATETVTDTGELGIPSIDGIDGNIIVFFKREDRIGRDVNADGDTNDFIIMYYDISTATLNNTEVVGFSPSIDGNIIAFFTGELQIGQDLNGDGDTSDNVLRYYDISIGTTTNTGAVGLSGFGQTSIDGNIIAFVTREVDVGQDLNGDGSITTIGIVQYHDISTGITTNTEAHGLSGAERRTPTVSGNIIAFGSGEVSVGQDLNGDGDTNDLIIRYYDISTSTLTNTGAQGGPRGGPSVEGNIIVFPTRESDFGQDLNGDRDMADDVLRYYDISTGTLTNTGVVGRNPALEKNIVAFHTFERSAGQDLNGDRDKDDIILRYYDITTGRTTNTRVEGIRPSIQVD